MAGIRPLAHRRVWPLGAAVVLHLGLAALIAGTPPRRLPPALEPLAINIVVVTAPAPPPKALLVGAADLQEAAPASASWPLAEALSLPAPPVPRPTPAFRSVAARPAPMPSAGPSDSPTPPPIAPSSSAVADWEASLSAWVERHRRYPPAARFRQEEGIVRVRFDVDGSGAVRQVALEAPSGSPALDAAALALFTGAVLPPPPAGLDPARRTISLPIRYRLE